MPIGELVSKSGLSASRIRFYETRGPLRSAARRENDYRDFDDRALEVLRFVDQARSSGFSLPDNTTDAQNLSAGVLKPCVLRGLSFIVLR